MTTSIISVCVYCGARSGRDPEFLKAAQAVGRAIAERGWRLVYGAGDIGIMGEVARAAQSGGADTLGVIPQHLVDAEVAKRDLSQLIVTETMHERKKVMFMNADAVAVLPGGAGSLDEFFEVLTWAQLGLHNKPVTLLNISGYWDPLIALIDHVIAAGFASDSLRDHFGVASTIDTLIESLGSAKGR